MRHRIRICVQREVGADNYVIQTQDDIAHMREFMLTHPHMSFPVGLWETVETLSEFIERLPSAAPQHAQSLYTEVQRALSAYAESD